ncbi:MAG: protein kinase [Pseudomonadota bacterium]
MTAVGEVKQGTELNGIYRIDEKIDIGGMGEVYRGHNIQTNDPVAIKIVLPELARDETILALFRKEASVLNHLSHQAIVRYHVFTIDPGIGRPYLAMEFVDGESLAARAVREPLSVDEAVQLTRHLASGLQTAHDAGVIHRDLSPDNIILKQGQVGSAKIIDFGIAKSAQVGGGTLLGGKFAGKYNFVSPEQLGLYGGEISPKSDIYSLGLVIASALTGAPIDMSGSQVEVVEKRRRVPDLAAVSPALRPLITEMLQPDPADRPESMIAIVERLARPLPEEPLEEEEPAQPAETTVVTDVSSVPPQADSTPADAGLASDSGTPEPGSVPPTPPRIGDSAPPQMPLEAPPQTPSAPPEGPAPPVSPAPPPPPEQPPAGSAPPGALQPPPVQSPPIQPASFAGSAPPRRAQPAAVPKAAEPKRGSGRGLLAAAITVLILAGGGGGAYYAFRPSDPVPVNGDDNRPILIPNNGTGQQANNRDRPSPVTNLTDQQGSGDDDGSGTDDQSGSGDQIDNQSQNGGDQQASLQNQGTDPVVQKPDDVVNRAAALVSAVDDFRGGECFYAAATNVSDASLSVEGFGLQKQPFETLDKTIQDSFGIEPSIGLRQVAAQQCAVVEFLAGIRDREGTKPALDLSNDWIKSGDSLSGTVSNLGSKTTSIFLIDNEGVVYNLGRHLERTGDEGRFNIKLVDQAPRQASPQLILIITTTTPVDLLQATEPVLAKSYFPALLRALRSSGGDVGTVMRFFKLGG